MRGSIQARALAGAVALLVACGSDGASTAPTDAGCVADGGDAMVACGGGNTTDASPSDAAGACGTLNGSCTPPRGTGNPNCAEYAGFVGAQAAALESQCTTRGHSWSAQGCLAVNPALNFGCALMPAGAFCTTNYVEYSDATQRMNAGPACMLAGGRVLSP